MTLIVTFLSPSLNRMIPAGKPVQWDTDNSPYAFLMDSTIERLSKLLSVSRTMYTQSQTHPLAQRKRGRATPTSDFFHLLMSSIQR